MADPNETYDAIVVGAGIGGLAAALALRRRGATVAVLERAANPRELGFALLLAPNAVHALRQLGVADQVIAGGHVATSGEMRRDDGRLLRRIDLDQVRHLLPEPTVTALRQVLHSVLLDAVGRERLALDCEVVGFSSHDDGVQVVTLDGRRWRGRVLVGADGAGSAIRRQLHPQEPPPRRSGLFGLRGVAHGVVSFLEGASGAQYFGRGIEAGLGRASETAVYWYMSIPASVVTAGSLDPISVRARAASGFDQRFLSIVDATARDDMRLDELFDRDPLEHWGKGRVTLLGDAAHPMLPHAGQGAAQALEDAVALARLLAGAAFPEPRLRAYENLRGARTAAVVRLARRNARIGSLEHPAARWLRARLIQAIPDRVILKSLVALGTPPEEG